MDSTLNIDIVGMGRCSVIQFQSYINGSALVVVELPKEPAHPEYVVWSVYPATSDGLEGMWHAENGAYHASRLRAEVTFEERRGRVTLESSI